VTDDPKPGIDDSNPDSASDAATGPASDGVALGFEEVLAEHLDRLVASLQEGRGSDPVYSVLVAAYRSPGPG
jgi:hypothetical protein